MSAFIVGKDHIDALVTLALSNTGHTGPMCWYFDNPTRVGQAEYTNAAEVGRMLWAENVRSVQGRYPDTVEGGTYPGPNGFSAAEIFAYRWRRTEPLSPVVGLKLIACFEYQSCETEGWTRSEAHAFCQALRLKLIDQLPGYDFAPWEYMRPQIGGVA